MTYVGYVDQEIAVNAQTTTVGTIKLSTSAKGLNDVIVVGYGTQRKRDVTGSIVTVKGESLQETPSANLTQALQGRAAGLEIQNVGVRPGSGAQIRIRGERSISGSNDPLIVLDGIPYGGSINDINQDDVASIEVLKDGSATAIYGSRGANGVILVTTRRGRVGETRVSLSSYYGVSTETLKYPVFNSDQYRAMRDLSPWAGGYTADELQGIATGRNTDWQDLLYKNGYQTDHNLTISGGSEASQFSIGGGYFKQTAVLPGQDFSRYSLKTTGDFNIGKRVKVGLSSQNTLTITHGSQFGVNVYPIITLSPLSSPYNSDGTINKRPAGNQDDYATTYNPLLLYQNNNSYVDLVRRYRTFNSGYAQLNIIPGLNYRLNAGFNAYQEEGDQFRGTDSYFRPATYNTASVNNSVFYSYVLEHTLNYEKTIAKKHRIQATALYSVQEDHFHNTSASKDSITSDFVQFYNLGQANATPAPVVSGGERSSAILSYMLRANYVFDDRISVTVTGRRDGSSRLGEGNKWHQYPAVGAAWTLTNEKFMRNIKAISSLKFRASWAETSNQSIAEYSTLGGVDVAGRYNYGTSQQIGYSITRIVDPNLDWEYTRTTDLGIDFGLLDDRITGTVDVYNAHTRKMLYGIPLPPTSGISQAYTTNIGEMSNKGLDVSLTGNIFRNPKGFNWTADLNFFLNRNTLLKLNDNTQQVLNAQLLVGQPISVIYDYRKLGIWQLDEAAEAARYNSVPGQIKLQDVNGDGKITADDQTVVGTGQAKIQGGINNRFAYKGFDFSFYLYGRFGGTLISQAFQPLSGYLTNNDGKRNGIAVNYWTPTNPSQDWPMPSAAIVGGGASTAQTVLGYYDASFVRVRSINFGYTFGKNIASKIKAQSLRLYINATNPFLLYSPYVKAGGVDPEPTGTGNQGSGTPGNFGARALTIGTTYPPTRSWILGLNVTF